MKCPARTSTRPNQATLVRGLSTGRRIQPARRGHAADLPGHDALPVRRNLPLRSRLLLPGRAQLFVPRPYATSTERCTGRRRHLLRYREAGRCRSWRSPRGSRSPRSSPTAPATPLWTPTLVNRGSASRMDPTASCLITTAICSSHFLTLRSLRWSTPSTARSSRAGQQQSRATGGGYGVGPARRLRRRHRAWSVGDRSN